MFHSQQRPYQLRVDMWDWEGARAYAQYDVFRVGSERELYKLHVGHYSGNAGDSMSYHDGMSFSTEDKDNDLHRRNCALDNKGGWWYNSCYSSSLNGVYRTAWYAHDTDTFADGVAWFTWKESEFYSLKKVELKIRPMPE
ncbi:Techylectin-5A [Lamellibrachia satsuma]|nr:Techylectin-5A [Lamellibrachia satsuma]